MYLHTEVSARWFGPHVSIIIFISPTSCTERKPHVSKQLCCRALNCGFFTLYMSACEYSHGTRFFPCLAFIPVSQRVRMNMWMKSSEIRQAQHFSESSKSLKHQTGEKVLFCPFSYPSFKHCSIQLHFQMCLCRHSTSVARKFKEGSWITSQPSHFVLVPKFSLAL